MCAKIYGVDSEKAITPIMVRDAIVNCFQGTHCELSDLGCNAQEFENEDFLLMVKKAFTDADADYDNPNKSGIIKAVDNLAGMAESFRDPKMIKDHYGDIQKLINKL